MDLKIKLKFTYTEENQNLLKVLYQDHRLCSNEDREYYCIIETDIFSIVSDTCPEVYSNELYVIGVNGNDSCTYANQSYFVENVSRSLFNNLLSIDELTELSYEFTLP